MSLKSLYESIFCLSPNIWYLFEIKPFILVICLLLEIQFRYFVKQIYYFSTEYLQIQTLNMASFC